MLAAATAIRKTNRLPIAFVCKPYLETPIIKLLENSPPNILVYTSPNQEHEICIFYDTKTLQEHLDRLSRDTSQASRSAFDSKPVDADSANSPHSERL